MVLGFPKKTAEGLSLPLKLGVLVGSILCLAGTHSICLAGSHKNATKCTVKFNFRISIPQMLYLNVGSPDGGANTLSFDAASSSVVADGQGNPPTVATVVRPIDMRAQGTVPMNLVATYSPEGLRSNDGTQSIPFSEVSWAGRGGLSDGVLGDDGQTVIEHFLRRGTVNGSYRFIYGDPQHPSQGTYSGTITLTLSAL